MTFGRRCSILLAAASVVVAACSSGTVDNDAGAVVAEPPPQASTVEVDGPTVEAVAAEPATTVDESAETAGDEPLDETHAAASDPASPTSAITAASAIDSRAPSSGDVRDVDFFNDFVYGTLFDDEHVVVVGDGEYTDESINFFVLDVQFGDVTGDGIDDAVVQTGFDTGGSGRFGALQAYAVRGDRLERLGWIGTGDRADGGVRHWAIVDGTLEVDRFSTTQGACCPTATARHRYAVGEKDLIEIERYPSLRFLSIYNEDGPDPLRFLANTSAAVIERPAGRNWALISFEAGQSQRLTIRHLDGPTPAAIELVDTATDALVADGVSELSTLLPATTTYWLRVDGTDDIATGSSFVVSIENDGAPQVPAWTPQLRDVTAWPDPEARLQATWPAFDGQDELNALIEARVTAETDWWIDSLAEVPPLDRDPSGGSYEYFHSVVFAGDGLVSIRHSWYEYVCCRPYPNLGHDGMVVDLVSGTIVSDGDLLDLSRLPEIHDLWVTTMAEEQGFLGASDELADLLYLEDTTPGWRSLVIVPGGLEFGSDRRGPLGASLTVVSFGELGDLLAPGLLESVVAGVAPTGLA